MSAQYEYGFDRAQFRAWRKEIRGPKKRGPVEFSKPAQRDPAKGLHDAVVWVFQDGYELELGAVTQDLRHLVNTGREPLNYFGLYLRAFLKP